MCTTAPSFPRGRVLIHPAADTLVWHLHRCACGKKSSPSQLCRAFLERTRRLEGIARLFHLHISWASPLCPARGGTGVLVELVPGGNRGREKIISGQEDFLEEEEAARSSSALVSSPTINPGQ